MPSVVRKPAAACAAAAGGNTSMARTTDDIDHYSSKNNNSPGKKQSAKGAVYLEGSEQKGGGGRQKDAAATRKRTADLLGEDIVDAKMPSVESASNGGGTIRPRKKKAASQPAPAEDWCVQRIVRDLGRLDVLRRGDVGPDVVSDDEDEAALDNLVRKLVAEADEDEDGHLLPHLADDGDGDYDDNFWVSGDNYDDDHPGGAMDIDDMDDDFMPAVAPDRGHGEDADSIAVVTQNGNESLADGATSSSTGIQVAAARATSTELPPTDVNYNHGARNPLNDPTAKSVYQPGDDDALGGLRGLAHRQIEWFAASSKDVADRKSSAKPVVLGQVGFRCVHCAHIPFPARGTAAVSYPKRFTGIHNAVRHYLDEHLVQCREIPSNIKSHRKSLAGCYGKQGKQGKQRRQNCKLSGEEQRKHLINGLQSVGIIEKDGHLVYDKSGAAAVVDRRDVIGSDGSEEGYWLCDKCQSMKFANFEEACTHEETCCGEGARPDGLDQSGRLQNDDALPSPCSTNQGGGVYVLSLCCECNEVEDLASDDPMLLCDSCDSATHLTCTTDVPKLTEVPEGEWHCSKCAFRKKFKEKRFVEDQAITAAFTAIGDLLEDNFCTTQPKWRRLEDISVGVVPGIQSKFQTDVPNKRYRLCVVVGCTKISHDMKYRYMCRAHFARARFLEKIQTMPNGERRFPCKAKNPSLSQYHENAYIAVPHNANHGSPVTCSSAECRSLGRSTANFKYCAVCDNIFSRNHFSRTHRHEDEFAADEKQAEVETNHQAANDVGAGDSEIIYGFDSIRGHTKDRKRKGEYLFRVKWSNGEITSEPDTFLREDDRATFVAYLKSSGLSKTKKYAWANEDEHV